MKKILSIFGAFGVTAIGASSVVACGKLSLNDVLKNPKPYEKSYWYGYLTSIEKKNLDEIAIELNLTFIDFTVNLVKIIESDKYPGFQEIFNNTILDYLKFLADNFILNHSETFDKELISIKMTDYSLRYKEILDEVQVSSIFRFASVLLFTFYNITK